MTADILNEIIWDINTFDDPRMGGRGMHKKGLSENILYDNLQEITKEDLIKILVEFDYAIKSTFDSSDSDEAYGKITESLVRVFPF